MEIKGILDKCSEPFVLIKRTKNDYKYEVGEDIDIMARNGLQLCREILHLSLGALNNKISVRIRRYDEHHHVDFMEDDKLIVRIDIIDTLETFKEILLTGNEYAQLGFRLFEYAKNPSKKKHFDYVKDYFKNK